MLRLLALLVLFGAPNASAQETAKEAPKAEAPKAEPPKAEAEAPKADAKKPTATDDDEDDGILAPIRSGPAATTVEPPKQKDLKVGLLPIVPLGDAGKTLGEQITAELGKALNESATVDVVALGIPPSSGGTAVDVAAAEQAKKNATDQLEKSRALLEKLQFGKAKRSFETAQQTLAKAAPVLQDTELLVESWLGLAEIAARQAQEPEAERCLAYVVSLDPERELDKKRFPALFVSAHQKVRNQLLSGPRGKVLVDESATGAAILLDARETNAAPVRLLEVLPGQHLVRASREGQPTWGIIVEVKPDAETVVSPGFLAKDRKGPIEDLLQNRFSADSATVIAAAAKAAGLKGAVVGAAAKMSGKVALQLIYVDAATAKTILLPEATFQIGLLDLSIEVLPPREKLEAALVASKPELVAADQAIALVEGARAGATAEVTEMKVRYDVRVSKAPPRSRLGDDDDDADDKKPATSALDDEGDRSVVSGKSGTRKRLDGDSDRLTEKPKESADPDAPITEQAWFMPTVIAGGIAAGIALLGGTGVALVAVGVLPDPRPTGGAEVNVLLPQ